MKVWAKLGFWLGVVAVLLMLVCVALSLWRQVDCEHACKSAGFDISQVNDALLSPLCQCAHLVPLPEGKDQ